ncbi:MAG TPA: hypothetical protein V6D25_18890 [Leptolyngbyaceae cyanobacterium]
MEVSAPTSQINNSQLEAVDISGKSLNINRREFMQLSLAERRRILAEQADLILLHYQQDKEWQELEIGDLLNY